MNRFDPMLTSTALAGVALVALGFGAFGTSVGIGALAGAAFALLNVVAVRWTIGRVFAAGRAGFLFPIKLVAAMTTVYVLQRVFGLDPLGIALGYGALVIGLLVASARQASPTLRSREI